MEHIDSTVGHSVTTVEHCDAEWSTVSKIGTLGHHSGTCYSTVENFESKMEKCDTIVEHCEARVEHCGNTVEHCDSRVQHCYSTVESCNTRVENCDKTVEHVTS